MNKTTVILILLICLSEAAFGCTCYDIESFNLANYDQSENIAEIRIVKKIQYDYIDKLKQYKVDTLNWNKEYPPPPISPPKNHVEFIVEVIEVYKGKVKLKTKLLRANELNSSCYWEPEVGNSYIFYLGSISRENQKQTIDIYGCQRKIRNDNRNYNSEILGLVNLRDKINGKFKIDQSWLIQSKKKKYMSLQGEFRNGKRHGKWIIAEPIDYSGNNTEPRRKTLTLKYDNGKLICTKYYSPKVRHKEINFTLYWHQYYEGQKSR